MIRTYFPPAPTPGDVSYYIQRGATLSTYRLLGSVSKVTLGTFTPSLNLIYAFPFPIGKTVRMDRLMFNLTVIAGAGGVARAGIYRATSLRELYPSGLVVDGGEFATTGANGNRDAVVNVVLQPWLYWRVVLFGVAAPTISECGAGIPGMNDILGWQAANPPAPWSIATVAQAYGALPSTFPAGLALSATRCPAVWGRFAA